MKKINSTAANISPMGTEEMLEACSVFGAVKRALDSELAEETKILKAWHSKFHGWGSYLAGLQAISRNRSK